MVCTHRIFQLLTVLNKADSKSRAFLCVYWWFVGCITTGWFRVFWGTWILGALAYADDIVLITPTATAMRQMLAVCDKFAFKLDVLFNATKSKFIFFYRGSHIKCWCWDTKFFLLLLIALNSLRSGHIWVTWLV